MPKSLVVALFCLTPLSAQALYSPASAATTEANYDASPPFGYGNVAQSYLQIHGDLRGQTTTIQRMAFRRDGTYATNTTHLAKTLTASIYVGGGDLAKLNANFAANYTGARTKVATSRTYNVPDWQTKPATPPSAWDLLCPFDSAFLWTGTSDFVWEMRVHSMTSPHPMFADAHKTNPVANLSGTSYGTGCIATGRTSTFQLSGGTGTSRIAGHSFFWNSTNGIAGAGTGLHLGVNQVNVPIAGLCAPIYVDPLVVVTGTTSATGEFSFSPASFPFNAAWLGAVVRAQCVCLDAARGDAIKVAVSNGLTAVVPTIAPVVAMRVYNPNDDVSTAGFLDPSNTALGLVIRID